MKRKKILFACLHRPDRSPSQRFRFEQYLSFLEENGYECIFSYLLNEQDDKTYYRSGHYFGKALILIRALIKRLKESFLGNYDIVFVQRESFMLGTSFFERKFARRSRLVYDFDDAIWLPAAGSEKGNNTALGFLKDPQKTERIIKAAHLVFAGNQFLEQYARKFNDRVVIVPTTIDLDYHQLEYLQKQSTQPVCIGWTGSFSTVIHFESIEHVLERIREKYGERVCFKLIGDSTYQNTKLNLQGEEWSRETEINKLKEIDIGIMPLPDDEWSKGKCGLKGLQYMALGIPAVLSPVGVNSEIIEDGVNGFLAESEEEWIEKISRLVEDHDLRKVLGQKGRQTVQAKYSVEANKHLYLKSLDSLVGQPTD